MPRPSALHLFTGAPNKSKFGLLVILLLGLGYWAVLLHNHQEQRASLQAQTQLRVTQVSHALANQVGGLFSNIDDAALRFGSVYAKDPDDALTHLTSFFALTSANQAISQVALANPQGIVTYSSLAPHGQPEATISIADREHFRVHAQGQVDGLYIGVPVKGRVSGQWTIQLSRALQRNGHFLGVVVVSIPSDYLAGMFQDVFNQPHDVVELRRTDGRFLARTLDTEQALSQSTPSPIGIETGPDTTDRPRPATGASVQTSPLDHIQRFYAWATVPQFEVQVIAGVDQRAVLAPLEASIQKNLVLSALGTGLGLLAALLLLRFSQQRQRMFNHLHLVQAQLMALIARFPGGVVLENPLEHTSVTINPPLAQLLQLPETLKIQHDDLKNRIPAELREVLLPQAPDAEIPQGQEVALADGRVLEVVQFLLQSPHVAAGQALGRLSLVQDVTARHQHQSMLEQLALTDALTGLPNRRAFMQALEHECTLVTTQKAPDAALVFLDIDHFKKVNDTYGHSVGDEVISHLGHLLRQGLRTSDIPGRIGGEEFAVLLPKINLGQAQALAERLRQSLENNPVPTSAGPLVVHASFGVYPITRKTADAAQCLHRADMALYDAKNNGRNQVRTWHPGLQPR